MVRLNSFDRIFTIRSPPQWTRECFFGLLYWLIFLLVLEPGNLFRAARAGYSLAFDHEVLRIAVASLVGAAVTPSVMVLARRYLTVGAGRWRHRLIFVIGITGVALALILISCVLAAWGFEGKWLPSLNEVRVQIVCNWLLLVYAVLVFSFVANAVHLYGGAKDSRAADIPAQLTNRIPVYQRGRRSYVDVADIDWIETQGNYLALHVNSVTHLIRQTSAKFEAQLDPRRFVRIHRRFIVAVDQILESRPMGNGDAMVRLADGSELRASRRYKVTMNQRWREKPEH